MFLFSLADYLQSVKYRFLYQRALADPGDYINAGFGIPIGVRTELSTKDAAFARSVTADSSAAHVTQQSEEQRAGKTENEHEELVLKILKRFFCFEHFCFKT
ncbi:unnamed protein product [Gongylonema pulchrum]|uniref:Omp85 domain-containing protein n=1 Tax=Gongylonema pulchrum TaxID=637853 RepID=A0A183ET43_9BILA|nr:unnamed protein product [Gongylonema pulchrum]